MNDEFDSTTDNVRDCFVYGRWFNGNPERHFAEFDRWLAEHDDAVRAETLEVAAVLAESVDVWDEERTRSSDHDLIAAKLREFAESQKVASA
jgi:hypothetical protein